MRRSLLLSLALAACLPVCASASDWAQFRGPHRNGISPEAGINKNWGQKPPRTLWKVSLSDDGYAGPAVAGGKVYIVDHVGKQDVVRAIDIMTGKDVWKHSYTDGENANYGYSRATPAVSGGRVYTLGRMGMLCCLDAKSGRALWTKDIAKEFGGKKPTWLYSGSPIVDGNQVIVCPGGPKAAVVALDKTSGRTLWRGGGSDVPGYATPVVATIGGVRQYIVFTGLGAVSVAAKNGSQLWYLPWRTSYDINGASAVVMGQSVFLTSGYGHGGVMLNCGPKGASRRWESKEMQCRFSSPILLNGSIYGISEPGDLVCLDPATGRARWREGGFEFGGMVAVDGVLIAQQGSTGTLVMVKPSSTGFVSLGTFTPLHSQSWTAPIVADGKLIVRNKTTLACLSLK